MTQSADPPSENPKAGPPETPAANDRRSFFAAAMAVLSGAVAVLTPLGVGLASFLTPLFRRTKSAEVRVALLDQTPDDGQPRYFPVVADRDDAWTRYPAQRIGAVYLVRQPGEPKPTAFAAKCPHAGCFIGYSAGENLFKCPCHTSSFKLDGSRVNGDAEVAPRDMDRLEVEVRELTGGDENALAPGARVAEVWVRFVDFQTGIKERIPTA